jgi:hypothetical protein
MGAGASASASAQWIARPASVSPSRKRGVLRLLLVGESGLGLVYSGGRLAPSAPWDRELGRKLAHTARGLRLTCTRYPGINCAAQALPVQDPEISGVSYRHPCCQKGDGFCQPKIN